MPTVTDATVSAYLALGSNLGDRAANIRRAIDLLRAAPGVWVVAVSGMLDNPAVGGPVGSPPFLNAAAGVETTLDPHALLDRLLAIEAAMGRVRRERWGPRVIDLDILIYGDRVVRDERLTIPHPRMHERRFVLAPLSEVAPDLVHPTQRKSIRTLLERT